jgi:hypothetical protein
MRDATGMASRITNRKLLGIAAIVIFLVVLLSWLGSRISALFSLV